MSEVFDLDAVAREAAGEPFRFRFGGEDYELPSHVDIRAIAKLSIGQFYEALQLMLGDEQWQRMLAADAVFDDQTLRSLMEAYAAHSGTELGESSASTGSSRSTVRPSKRTSNGTTRSISVR
jgi:hypothetical protein